MTDTRCSGGFWRERDSLGGWEPEPAPASRHAGPPDGAWRGAGECVIERRPPYLFGSAPEHLVVLGSCHIVSMAHDWKTVRMSSELIGRIDAVRGQTPLARWVAELCEAGLADGGAPAPQSAAKATRSAVKPPVAQKVSGGLFCPHCDWLGSGDESCPEHHRAKQVPR